MTSTLNLRDYQKEAIEAVLSRARAGVRRQLIQLPTGAGKTVVAAALSAKARGRTLMLVHRDELIQQSVEKFGLYWPEQEIGVVRGPQDEHNRRVVVASVQTLMRPHRMQKLDADSVGLLIVDEAHHSLARGYIAVLEALGFHPEPRNGKVLVGITATPFRGDKLALGEVFDEIVYRKTVGDLIEEGYLAAVRGIRVETRIDLSQVRQTRGDFNTQDLSLAVDTEKRNRLMVEAWKQYGEGRRTVVFGVDVAHAKHIAEAFTKAGVASTWVSGDLDLDERRRRLADFRDGKTRVLANCDLLLEGWDEPSVECLIMARPTKSQTLYIQAIGRGLRAYPGKSECIVLELTDNRHDLVGLGTLEGLGFRETEEAKGTPRPGEREEEAEAGDEALAHAMLVASPMDLLARSRFRWHHESRRRLRLEAGPGEDVFLVRGETGGWEVELRGKAGRQRLSPRPLPFEYASGVAEDYVRSRHQEWFSSSEAAWRKAPATEKQVELLHVLGVDQTDGLTREGAMEAIRAARFEHALKDPEAKWRSTPMTEGQRDFIRRFRMEVPTWMTKGEATDVIGYLKAKRWQEARRIVNDVESRGPASA